MKYILCFMLLYWTYSGFSQLAPAFKKSEAFKFASKVLNEDVSEMEPMSIKENLTGAYFQLQMQKGKLNYLYVGRINTCKSSGCDISKADVATFEYMDYFAVLDSSGKILDLKIYNYAATHGHEVTSRSWLSQFKGYKGSHRLEVGKDIDAISGATSSVYAFTQEINWMIQVFKEKIQKL